MERCVDHVQVNFSPGHCTEWRGVIIVLPISLTAHENDLAAEKSSSGVLIITTDP